jgi:hypothetical protein
MCGIIGIVGQEPAARGGVPRASSKISKSLPNVKPTHHRVTSKDNVPRIPIVTQTNTTTLPLNLARRSPGDPKNGPGVDRTKSVSIDRSFVE